MTVNFCVSCGHAMETRSMDGVERRACTQCTSVHWGNYSVGVGALVVKDNKVLLVRRAQDPGKGNWTNPGGYIEQMEPIEQTIVREVQEEAGVQTRVKRIVALRDQPRTVHNIYIAFEMEYVDGEPKPDGYEVDAAGFFTLEEMQTMQVANFTKWLVDIALHGQSGGLHPDLEPVAPSPGNGFFRIS
jgi:ADP-ribose pyrophosphatase YjhB (NUDIX family)